MKLYEIDAKIEALLDRLEPDPETGEIDDAGIFEALEALQMDRAEKLRNICKAVLRDKACVAAIKAEEDRLKKRRCTVENRAEHLLWLLERATGGEKTDLGGYVVSYRKSESLEVGDCAAAADWLGIHGYGDCVKERQPELIKNDVKLLLKSGVAVPGCKIVEKKTCNVR